MNKFNTFVEELSKDTRIKVAYKDESKLMKLIGTVLFFNKGFMDIFITTIGNTVYYPSKQWVVDHEMDAILVMAHEYEHMKDNQRFGKILYPLMYLFPQCLGLLSLLAVFAFVTPYAWLFLLFLLCFAPIPAPGRKYIELRGYKMSLYIYNLYLKSHSFLSDERKERLVNMCDSFDMYFTGGAYYFMWPPGVKSELKKFASEVVNDRAQETETYVNVREAFEKAR